MGAFSSRSNLFPANIFLRLLSSCRFLSESAGGTWNNGARKGATFHAFTRMGGVKQVNKIGNYTADVDKDCWFSLHCAYPVTSLSEFAHEQISIKEWIHWVLTYWNINNGKDIFNIYSSFSVHGLIIFEINSCWKGKRKVRNFCARGASDEPSLLRALSTFSRTQNPSSSTTTFMRLPRRLQNHWAAGCSQ